MVATFKFGIPTIRRHSATRKNIFLYPQGNISGVRKLKKGKASTLITAATCIHLLNPVLTDLTRNTDLVLIDPVGKDGMLGNLTNYSFDVIQRAAVST